MTSIQSAAPRDPNVDAIHFVLRRLHSLTGIVPIGVFLIAHLTTNSTLVWGGANSRAGEYADDFNGRAVATFQEEVSFINGLPALLLIEITLWGAIAFHSVLGFYYAFTGKGNTKRYPHMDNWRYTLQRISGYVGIFFIIYHVGTLRWGWTWLVPDGTKWSHHWSASTLAAAMQGSPDGVTTAGIAVALGYFIGVTLLVFHFANGLWTAAITWGLTVSIPAQRRWGAVCAMLGLGLTVLGWASIYGAMTVDPVEAFYVERELHEKKHGEVPEPPAFVIEMDLAIPEPAEQSVAGAEDHSGGGH
ncbi:MAG: hypothetical protein AAGB51_14620 [Planctomycetota bacterium]